jgi:CHRD domain
MILMYLKQIRLPLIVAIALIFATGSIAIIKIKPVSAQSESSAITTTQHPASGQEYSAKMTGDEEVPPVSTGTTGTIKLAANSQQDALDYNIDLTNLNGVVIGAQIHMGTPGANGPIVADLNTPGTDAAAAASSSSSGGVSAMTSNSIGGTITSADLKGPLEGKQVSDLVKLIGKGRTYASVNTEQNPRGEIRGQLSSSSSPDTTSTGDTNSASASTSQTLSSSASATAP